MAKDNVVAVVNTGGTILSRFDPGMKGWVSSADVGHLLEKLPGGLQVPKLRVIEHSQINAYRMDSRTVYDLAKVVSELSRDPAIRGIVVVHGTASMEETAYFLELTNATDKPIVMTGAQRRFDDVGSDGPLNFYYAIRIAASDEAAGRGVLVTFDGTIHGARDVIKVHNQSLSAFGSRDGGAIGFVTSSTLSFLARPDRRLHFDVPSAISNVQLIKLVQDNDDLFVRACIEAKVDGIVLEGVGGGGVPDRAYDACCEALELRIPIVVVPRTTRGGIVTDGGGGGIGGGDYAHKGSSGNLLARGAIPAGYLSGLKARILLMVALGRSSEHEHLRSVFARA